ncbi:helix-turn-helix domain-containing protein [Anaerospora hongkongensis]|uniref:helix-turn-helix domain-containing protein n=1 Tax=Anaerospora hongkongensis TaxID=244830 RepID=UPI0028A09E2D|nr:helix-turn-helix domain-containing protein [Anaerospora hongkongensis]
MAKGKYEEWLTAEGLLQLEAWARNGLTDEQIASNMGVSVATLYNYKKDFVEILEALKRGKEVVDIQVENALLKRALGYQFTEVTRERVYNESTKKHKFEITKKVIKEVQPDTTAQIFWLKNRKPAEWRDRKDIDANIRMNNPFEGLTREQLLKIAGEEDV